MSQNVVIATLHASLAQLPPGALVVAFSGGMDSTVLLHALAQIPVARERGLRAIHVDHGLHPDSARWAQHCHAFAAGFGIALTIVKVKVAQPTDSGPEAAARQARHAAYAEQLAATEILALAHHADDQAETILLKLLRGAGPEGLGGMRTLRQCGKGYLWRPLLGLAHEDLAAYAHMHALHWIDDPSNADTHLRRNFLRHEILPRLAQHWPDAPIALAHSAGWARAAADFIAAETQHALTHLRGVDPATLRWQPWLDLPDALRDPVLRLWLRQLDLPEPAHFHVAELERQLREAGEDRLPCISWRGAEIRRYRDMLYAMPPLASVSPDWEAVWDGVALNLPDGGTLTLKDKTACDVRLASSLQVRYRRGGERMKPAGHAHARELRSLLQEAGIPPWLRERIPLVFADDELIAAGDLILGATASELCARHDAHIVWTQARPGIDSAAPLR
jgi:tRNA(Ile)-lysidine synthase